MHEIPQSDEHALMVWQQFMLMAMAHSLYSAADTLEKRELIKHKVWNEWMRKKGDEMLELESNDRKARMFAEISRWLQSNGWPEDAKKFQQRAEKRKEWAERNQLMIGFWNREMQSVVDGAFD
jgi:hypothetical protein